MCVCVFVCVCVCVCLLACALVPTAAASLKTDVSEFVILYTSHVGVQSPRSPAILVYVDVQEDKVFKEELQTGRDSRQGQEAGDSGGSL